jgi:hypothetical protein
MADYITDIIERYEIDLQKVKQKYVWTLQYVKEQTPELCLVAVNQAGLVLKYVREQTPEICLAAVQESGLALYYVREQTPEICLAAIKRTKMSLYYVKDLKLKEKLIL